ncbi:MAG: ornithine cyclodeaminase family protein [Candidatus Thermoplasmatota archaeon]|nr:ornithine cyclodeaminase family protein [Candidatus Thermoplasmatota archaeon]
MPLYIREEEVAKLLDVSTAINVLKDAFRMQSEGKAVSLPRSRIRTENGILNVLPSTAEGLAVSGLKAYFGGRNGVSFVVLLFSTAECKPLAIIEAERLGQIRTGAVTGMVTDIMADINARIAGCIGSGYQAETQIEAICNVRRIDTFYVYSRNAGNREKFAPTMGRRVNADVVAVPDRSMFRETEIIVTATNSRIPVISHQEIPEHCHINAIGANRIESRELDAETLCSAEEIVVDSVEQSKVESGDLAAAVSSGCIGWDDINEIRDLVSGRRKKIKGRRGGITIFKSLGIGLEDLAVGAYVYRRAAETGLGTRL